MDYLKDFIIPFRGLKAGNHHFDYIIDNRFFESIEYAELSKGKVKVLIELTLQERMLIFDFSINGFVEVSCDRCLGLFNQDISGSAKLIVKFGEDWVEESDEVIVIPESEHQFDVSKYLYEYIILLLPMRCIHPNDEDGVSTCDQEIVKRLGHHPVNSETDPRWDVLLKLKKESKQQ